MGWASFGCKSQPGRAMQGAVEVRYGAAGSGRVWQALIGKGLMISARRASALPAGFFETQFRSNQVESGKFGFGQACCAWVGCGRARAADSSTEGFGSLCCSLESRWATPRFVEVWRGSAW